MEKRKNIYYISCLQIIGPIFVILGHSLNGIKASGFWYIFSKQFIYLFHMPLFFMISGYLLSRNGWQKNKSYRQFIKNKFIRLIIPYLVWNFIFIYPKKLLQNYISDNVSSNPLMIFKMFLYPRQNIWGHTWFLVALFLLYLLTPIWKLFFADYNKIKYVFLFAGIILYCLPINTELLCIGDLNKNVLFFMLGLYLGAMQVDKFLSIMKKTQYLWLILSIILSALFLYWYKPLSAFRFIPCFPVLMALLSFSRNVKKLPLNAIKLSKLSFGIYIMHWPVMIVCRVLLYQILKFNETVTVIIMIFTGYCIPLITIWMLRKIQNESIKKPLRYLLGV